MMEPCLLVPLNSKQKHGQSYVIQFAESYFSTFSASVSALTSRPATALDRPTPPSTRPTDQPVGPVGERTSKVSSTRLLKSSRQGPRQVAADGAWTWTWRRAARRGWRQAESVQLKQCHVSNPLLVRYSHKWPRNPRHPAPRCTR